MAKDLKIDFTTGELKNDTVSGKDRILQSLKIANRIIKGEWELDTSYGISIFEDTDTATIEQDSKIMSAQVDGVIAVKSVNTEEEFDSNGEGSITTDSVIQLDSDIIRIKERIN